MEKKQVDLLIAVKNGDDHAFSLLSEEYRALLEAMVNSFGESCPEADPEDLWQEAALALYKAAMRFDLSQNKVTFGLYAKICIKNRLISVRRKYKTQSKLIAERDPKKMETSTAQAGAKPRLHISEDALSLLSPFEKKVFALYAKRCSYSEIARLLSRSEKSIDNAIYRIKRKLRGFRS